MAVLKFKYKVPAFSLIEVLVAFVILLMVFFIAIHFFTQLSFSGFDTQRMNAANTLEAYIHQLKMGTDFSVSRDSLNGWQLTREALLYEDSDSLVQVTFTIYKKDSIATPFLSRTLLMDLRQQDRAVLNDITIEP